MYYKKLIKFKKVDLFLNKAINQLFNGVWKNDFKIKNHYLIESNSGFFLKFTVKDKYHFLAALANIYNTSIDNIKNKCIDILKIMVIY